MSLRTLFATLAVFSAAAASAQPAFGLKAGARYCVSDGGYSVRIVTASRHLVEYDGTPSGLGFHVGCSLTSSTSAAASFRSEVLYASKRLRQENDVVTPLVADSARRDHSIYELRLDYLEIPLLIGLGSDRGFSFQFGLCPSFGLAAKTKISSTITMTAPGYSEVVQDTTWSYISSSTGALVLDLQLGIRYGWGRGLELGLVYTRDMTSSSRSHVSAFQLSAGYRL
jgi:Outer membrane protein beta-barrel domain